MTATVVTCVTPETGNGNTAPAIPQTSPAPKASHVQRRIQMRTRATRSRSRQKFLAKRSDM